MDTRELIILVLRCLYGAFVLSAIAYSVYMGLRYGFRFPRSLHFMAVAVIVIEVGILAAFPVPLTAITLTLGSLLALLPVSPYIGWILAGGPVK
ncbi:MAG TPA: hypothetical protein P5205_03600 [Candidatus Paceibacterota bacterium]|nr:hypothetical protein [Verrucomicrobiota bacterium]HSA09434.1 hypothetical protein [Candidatus Paceibacterota bacterium]